MSVPDTLRMDLADPRIYDKITLDRRQAQALVNEVDSLRDQVKGAQHEIDQYESAAHEMAMDQANVEMELQKTREQRDQLLAQLDQLCIAVKSYRTGRNGSKLREVLSDSHAMIIRMNTP